MYRSHLNRILLQIRKKHTDRSLLVVSKQNTHDNKNEINDTHSLVKPNVTLSATVASATLIVEEAIKRAREQEKLPKRRV